MIFYCDGLCEPRNPGGYACWAWVMLKDRDLTEEASAFGCVGHGPEMTNNIAEYNAVGRAIRFANDNNHINAVFRTDSQLVVNQVNGTWRINKPHLLKMALRTRELLKANGGRLEWVPREENEIADTLSRKAYAEATKRS